MTTTTISTQPTTVRSTPRLHAGAATHAGRRAVNEDAVLVSGPLLAVADGVGGAPRGDLASTVAVERLDEALDPAAIHLTSSGVAGELTDAFHLADDAVADLARRWRDLRGAATTMCAALIYTDDGETVRAVVANVGDSRCHVLSDERVRQVGTDQTLGAELRAAGVDPVPSHADSIVTSVVGGGPDTDMTVDLHSLRLAIGDAVVLCTDGITDVVDPSSMVALVNRSGLDPTAAAQELVRLAHANGSDDNLTAVVGRILPAPATTI